MRSIFRFVLFQNHENTTVLMLLTLSEKKDIRWVSHYERT